MRKGILGLWVVLIFALVFSQMGLAQEMKGWGPQGKEMHPGKMGEPGLCAKLPGLTEDQQKKIEAMRLALQKETLLLRNDLQTKRSELALLMATDNPDKAKINAKLAEIGKVRGLLQEKMVNHKLAIREVLSPEQRAKFDSRLLKGGPRIGHGMGWGMGPGCGMRCGP